MIYVAVIVLLALVQFMYFGVAVGRARIRYDVRAPSVVGDEIFERFHRAHQNILEQLVIFIPAVCAAGYFASPLLAVACGLAFLVGRAWYFRCYIVDPDTRGPGMVITSLSSLILLTSALVGAIRSLLS